VLAIHLPPLRLHKADIPLLIAHFLAQRKLSGQPMPSLSAAIIERFLAYEWPGNVRELFNELRRYFTTGDLEFVGNRPPRAEVSGTTPPFLQDGLTLDDAVRAFEQYYIDRALRQHRGQRLETAAALGVSRRTLYNKLNDHAAKPE